ncbi:MAG TPA: hypothetical protein VF628_09825 [Allosphingosinicella sp.]|jgi:hypothetical protein
MPSKRAIKNVGKAFDRMRQAGGSIVNGQSGTNYTKSGTGESFANYVAKNLCDDEDGLKHIASMINAAIDEGAR